MHDLYGSEICVWKQWIILFTVAQHEKIGLITECNLKYVNSCKIMHLVTPIWAQFQ